MRSNSKVFLVLFFVAGLLSLAAMAGCRAQVVPTTSPISPVSTPTTTPTPPTSPPATATSAPTASDWVTDTPDPQETPLIISNVMRREDGVEVIFVTNISDAEQALKNRTVLDPQTMEYIDLPDDEVLQPEESFKVYNGPVTPGEVEGLVWQDKPTLKLRGESLILVNQAGRVLWNYVNRQDYP